jgi:DNA-binding response OmpR family regulator
LVVDDDPDITLTFKAGLEANGFLVDIFNSPLDALSAFEPKVYDLVVLDIRMPKMSGFDLYTEIEKIDSSTKVCFITAFAVYYESLRDILIKPKTFIKKPIELDKLVDKLRAEMN